MFMQDTHPTQEEAFIGTS